MPQVCAVRVTDTDVKEALQQCPGIFVEVPLGVAPTSLAARCMAYDAAVSEEPFLAQLTIRAALLNHVFLDQVMRVISSHSEGGVDIDTDLLDMQGGQSRRFLCRFAGMRAGSVEVHSTPPKRVARMREKLREYAYPHPRSLWPLCANILDPVRLSIVCEGPTDILEVGLKSKAKFPENKPHF